MHPGVDPDTRGFPGPNQDFITTMPVAKGPSITSRSAITAGIAGVLVAVALVALVIWASGASDKVIPKIGDDTFDAGFVESAAAEIDDRGPILYPDLVGKGRPIWVNHTGNIVDESWHAFEAVIPGDDADCLANWDPEQTVFVNSCDASVTYPQDGTGLTQIPVVIRDDRVIVDINGVLTDE